jgi:hypothetical protein
MKKINKVLSFFAIIIKYMLIIKIQLEKNYKKLYITN